MKDKQDHSPQLEENTEPQKDKGISGNQAAENTGTIRNVGGDKTDTPEMQELANKEGE